MNIFFHKSVIVAHDGSFHTDDVFACATLSLFLEKEKKSFKIIRTRNPNKIKTADFVVDVGAIYDEEKNRFDHHQPGGAGERENGIPYASFGLVWKKYGKEICENERVAEEIDNILVCSIDAVDNGYELFTKKVKGVMNFSIGDTISFLFNKDEKDSDFLEAVDFTKKILKNIIGSINRSVARRKKVENAYKNSEDKKIIIIEDRVTRGDVWLVISKLEEPLFAVFQGLNDDDWKVLANRINMDSFMSRKPMPASWGGLEKENLARITEVPDVIFCHKSLFLAAVKSKEGAIKLAKKALE